MTADEPLGRWAVVCRPVDDGTDKTAKPALAVALTDGVAEIDVAHVAFLRRQGKDKEVPFDRKLQEILDVAHEAATTINEFEEYLDELRTEQTAMAQRRVEGIIGKVSLTPV